MISIEKIKSEKLIKELLEFSIINIDKPSGPTSFGVDVVIKKALNIEKTSHFGTLDPMVTGVLPVALSRACKPMPYFIGKDKTYVGILRVHKEISLENLQKTADKFTGKINQTPPRKSRVKRVERKRTVYNFKITEQDENNKNNFIFEAKVEAGTYIRKLIHDLGILIGGAHMLELRRTQASIFNEENSVDIYRFLEIVEEYNNGNELFLRNILIPGEIISNVLPIIEVKKEYVKKLQHGSPLIKEYVKNDIPKTEKIAVFNGNTFIGVFRTTNEKTILARPEYVFQPIK